MIPVLLSHLLFIAMTCSWWALAMFHDCFLNKQGVSMLWLPAGFLSVGCGFVLIAVCSEHWDD